VAAEQTKNQKPFPTEGTGVASDVDKVEGEDPDNPISKGGQGEVGTSVISDRGCVSLGSLTMKPWDST